MTTFRTPGDATELLKSLQARLAQLERHRHPAQEQAQVDEGTRPKPPTDVVYDYVTAAGVPAIRTDWTPPTENIDDTPLTDLAGYEVEHQVGGELLYDDPTELSPTRPNEGLNALHDTRGTEGIIRGLSGASVRSPDGRDLWLWSDALVGAADGSGMVLDGDRVHNAASWTLNRTQQQDLVGASNLLEGLTLQLVGATAASDGSFAVDGYPSTALTATAATVDAYYDVPVEPGQVYAVMAHHQSADQDMAWEFRDSGTLLSGSQAITAGMNRILTPAAPAQATTLRFYPYRATGRTAGQVVSRFVKAGVFASEHLMLSWRAPASQEQYTNVFTNPEGRGITAGSYSQLVATNRSTNPSFLVNTTGLTGLNSATVSRVLTGSAFVGIAVGRVRRAAAGNAAIFRLGSVAVSAGQLTARFRVRRGAPLASASSTLTVVAQALNGSTVLASSPAQVLELDDDWQVVELEVTGPATTNALRVEANASGTAWVASDLVDVDGVEFYQGYAPPSYFDGSTSPRNGFIHAWTGTAGQSTSTMTATSTRRINHFTNPRFTSTTSTAVVGGASHSVSGGVLSVTATAAGQGVRLSQPTSFPIGATVSASALVKGSGQVRLVINGTPTSQSEAVTLNPGEGRRVALSALLSGTSTVTVDIIAQGPATFTVTEPLIEQGLPGAFFHGASTVADRIISWEGAVDASRSIASAPTPTSWAPVDPTRERLAYSSGMVEVTALKDTVTLAARVSSTALTPGAVTVTADVNAPGATVQLQAVYSNATTAQSAQILPGDPVRHTFTVPAGATSSTFTVVLTGNFAGGDTVEVGNVTLVQGSYWGGPFTGEMDAAEGAVAQWTGAEHASTSLLTLDAADQYLDDRPVSLVAASDAGLAPSHLLRPEDAVILGTTAYVFMTGYVRSPSATAAAGVARTGKTYLASFDLTSGEYLDVVEWAAPSTGVWGTAVASDGTWIYVYGVQAGSVQVARTPLADPLTVTFWDGVGWVSSGAPGGVAVGTAGFYGVRDIGGAYVALEIPNGSTLRRWDAAAPQGPFSITGVQDSWSGIPRQQPRFHPQFDAIDQGIVISTVDADAIRFITGPPGTAHPSFDFEIWGDRQTVTDPTHYTLDVERGTPYRVRVRAVNDEGRWSDWALGEAEVYWPEAPPVERPSAPQATVSFRGARIYWDGRDITGQEYEGFIAFHLHMDKTPGFEPTIQNRVASDYYPGGTKYLAVPDYDTYYVTVRVETVNGWSDRSDYVSFSGERLSDPDLAGVLIDGAKVAKGTLNLEALTVGSFGNSLVANPGFEVRRPDDSTKPISWSAGHPRQPGGGTLTPEQTGDFMLDETIVLEGGRSLRIDTYATSSRQVVSDPFPVVPGDIYYVACKMRTSSLSADVKVTIRMGATIEDVNVEPVSATSKTATVFTSSGSFTVLKAEGQLEVPSVEPMYWASVSIEGLATGSPYSTWVDAVEVRQIVGTASIANAAVNRAQIALLAVDDARISDLHGGKIKAETIETGALRAGVLRTNMMPDPSFEESYAFTTWAPFTTGQGNVNQWRRAVTSTASAVTARTSPAERLGRSGARGLRLEVMAAGNEATVFSAAIPVVAGKAYRVQLNAISLGSLGNLVVQLFNRADLEFNGINDGAPFTVEHSDANWSKPPLVSDPSYVKADDFRTYSYSFTPSITGYAAIRILNFQPAAASAVIVDDVSVVEVGIGGASEVTAAGLRLFDNEGYEVGAFVSNRPNYFSVSQRGQAVMSVSEDGKVSSSALSVADPAMVELGGFPLLGKLNDYTPAVTYGALMEGHLDKLPRGLVAVGYITTDQTFTASGLIYRLSFVAEPGRSYELKLASALGRISAPNTGRGFGLRAKTPVSPGSETLTDLGALGWNYTHSSNENTWVTFGAIERTLRCNKNGTGSGGELNAGLNIVEIEVNAAAAATVYINNNVNMGIPVTVKDVGLDFPNTGIWLSQAQPNNQAKQTFTTVWKANQWRVYNQDGTQASPQPTYLEHGPVPGSSGNNRYSIVTFGGNSVSSTAAKEVGKTIATNLTGAVLESVEVYLYADDWYDNAGGTAYIRAFNSKSLPSNGSVSGAARQVPDWPKPGGRWVNLSDFSTSAIRGVLIGATGTALLSTYGRFRLPDAAQWEPMLRLRYTK